MGAGRYRWDGSGLNKLRVRMEQIREGQCKKFEIEFLLGSRAGLGQITFTNFYGTN
jgi:hypothetical protein